MPALGRFIAQRLAAALFTLGGAILFLFVIIQFVPGDLVSILLGPRATPQMRAAPAESVSYTHLTLPTILLV